MIGIDVYLRQSGDRLLLNLHIPKVEHSSSSSKPGMLDYVALIQPYDCSEVTLPVEVTDDQSRLGPKQPVRPLHQKPGSATFLR